MCSPAPSANEVPSRHRRGASCQARSLGLAQTVVGGDVHHHEARLAAHADRGLVAPFERFLDRGDALGLQVVGGDDGMDDRARCRTAEIILFFVLSTVRSATLFAMAVEDVVHLGGLEGDVPAPDAEAALGVDALTHRSSAARLAGSAPSPRP